MAGHVLRLARTDEEGAFALIHTTQVRSKPLDMKLTGTDGLAPYVVTIRHSQAASFMAKNCPVKEEEWIEILSAMLRQEHVEGMEAVASVDSESALVITFRKRVRGITQRLGAIELKHNPDEEIELYDWCGMSIEALSKAQETLASVTAKTTDLEETVRQLRSQLDELVEAKKSDEAELLEKFRDLLNEKKTKIREQQHALEAVSGAQSEFVKFETATQDDMDVLPPKGKKSRATKRKQPAQDDDDDDGDVEAMDVDSAPKGAPSDDSDAEQRDTTDAETETASEDDEEAVPTTTAAAAPPAQKKKQAPSKPSSSDQSTNVPTSQTPSEQADEPPKKRELPFNNRKQPPRTRKAAPPQPAGDETDSDDEL